MKQEIRVLNVRLPDDVIKWIDSLVECGVYNSRSEAIRDFIREQLASSAKGSSAKGSSAKGSSAKGSSADGGGAK